MSVTLRSLREERGLTQREVGDVIGVSPSTVSNYETGLSAPDVTMVPKLAQFFGRTNGDMLAALLADPITALADKHGVPREKVVAILADVA